MKLEKHLRPELAVAVAATAAICSPRARKALRRGVVYGVAGLLKAGDMISSFAGGVARGTQAMAASPAGASPAAAAANAAGQPVAQAEPEPQTQGASNEHGPAGPGAQQQ